MAQCLPPYFFPVQCASPALRRCRPVDRHLAIFAISPFPFISYSERAAVPLPCRSKITAYYIAIFMPDPALCFRQQRFSIFHKKHHYCADSFSQSFWQDILILLRIYDNSFIFCKKIWFFRKGNLHACKFPLPLCKKSCAFPVNQSEIRTNPVRPKSLCRLKPDPPFLSGMHCAAAPGMV